MSNLYLAPESAALLRELSRKAANWVDLPEGDFSRAEAPKRAGFLLLTRGVGTWKARLTDRGRQWVATHPEERA